MCDDLGIPLGLVNLRLTPPWLNEASVSVDLFPTRAICIALTHSINCANRTFLTRTLSRVWKRNRKITLFSFTSPTFSCTGIISCSMAFANRSSSSASKSHSNLWPGRKPISHSFSGNSSLGSISLSLSSLFAGRKKKKQKQKSVHLIKKTPW